MAAKASGRNEIGKMRTKQREHGFGWGARMRTKTTYIALTAIFLASVIAGVVIPVGEAVRALTAIPAVCALFGALFQILRDRLAHERALFLDRLSFRGLHFHCSGRRDFCLRKILAHFRVAGAAAARCTIAQEFLSSRGAINLSDVNITF